MWVGGYTGILLVEQFKHLLHATTHPQLWYLNCMRALMGACPRQYDNNLIYSAKHIEQFFKVHLSAPC